MRGGAGESPFVSYALPPIGYLSVEPAHCPRWYGSMGNPDSYVHVCPKVKVDTCTITLPPFPLAGRVPDGLHCTATLYPCAHLNLDAISTNLIDLCT